MLLAKKRTIKPKTKGNLKNLPSKHDPKDIQTAQRRVYALSFSRRDLATCSTACSQINLQDLKQHLAVNSEIPRRSRMQTKSLYEQGGSKNKTQKRPNRHLSTSDLQQESETLNQPKSLMIPRSVINVPQLITTPSPNLSCAPEFWVNSPSHTTKSIQNTSVNHSEVNEAFTSCRNLAQELPASNQLTLQVGNPGQGEKSGLTSGLVQAASKQDHSPGENSRYSASSNTNFVSFAKLAPKKRHATICVHGDENKDLRQKLEQKQDLISRFRRNSMSILENLGIRQDKKSNLLPGSALKKLAINAIAPPLQQQQHQIVRDPPKFTKWQNMCKFARKHKYLLTLWVVCCVMGILLAGKITLIYLMKEGPIQQKPISDKVDQSGSQLKKSNSSDLAKTHFSYTTHLKGFNKTAHEIAVKNNNSNYLNNGGMFIDDVSLPDSYPKEFLFNNQSWMENGLLENHQNMIRFKIRNDLNLNRQSQWQQYLMVILIIFGAYLLVVMVSSLVLLKNKMCCQWNLTIERLQAMENYQVQETARQRRMEKHGNSRQRSTPHYMTQPPSYMSDESCDKVGEMKMVNLVGTDGENNSVADMKLYEKNLEKDIL